MGAQGKFYIVNAGAGARENITLRGYALLRQADLVIASESQRRRFAADLHDKEVIDGGHSLWTENAARRMGEEEAARLEAALLCKVNDAWNAGRTIVLLESGDISLFSPYRGWLAAFAHLGPELVPGVSAFSAANALIARPLLTKQTQRLRLSGLEAVLQAGPGDLPDVWALFCMRLDLPALIDKVRALYPAETGVVIVIRAGYPEHEVIRCTVGELDRYRDREIPFPYCMIYLGVAA